MRSARRRASSAFPVLIGLVLGACASTGAGQADSSRNVMNADEIDQPGFESITAWDAVQRLRPHWLRSRATVSAGEVFAGVFLDGSRFGSVESLRNISASNIEEMRFLDPREATTRYGTGFLAGAIEVTTQR